MPPLVPEAAEWLKIWLPELSWLEKIIRPAAIYLFLLLGLRVIGKRQLSQMTLFDLLLLFILAEITQNAMIGDDFSIAGGFVGIATLLAMSVLFDKISDKSQRARAILESKPTILVYKGELLHHEASRNTMGEDDLFSTLRTQGIISLAQVRYAVLEATGEVSVVKEEEVQAVGVGSEECLTDDLRAQIAEHNKRNSGASKKDSAKE